MFLFRLREKIKHENVESCYNELLKHERFSRNDIERWQNERLYELLQYILEHNPFYSKYIKNLGMDFNSKQFTTEQLLSLFPVIDKNFIREHFEEWLSSHIKYGSVQLCSTSGSSGKPFRFYQTPIAGDYKMASKYRLYKRFGINIDDLQLCYGTGYNSDIKSIAQKLKVKINQRYILRRYFVDVSQNGGNVDYSREIKRINKLRIKSIWGYPSTIYEIAKYSIDAGEKICNRYLRFVILSGEGHTMEMLTLIKIAFGENISIIDEYNSVESFIAGNCKSGKMHLNEDVSIFEVLHADGTISNTGAGELIITNLFSYDFPYIRYRNGDIVNISDEMCDCKSGFRVLKSVDGRSACFIFNGDKRIPHATCTHMIPHSEYRDLVSKFQFIQIRKEEVIVKIVPTQTNVNFSGLELMLRKLFCNINVKFEYVNDIPKEKSGKFNDVINLSTISHDK